MAQAMAKRATTDKAREMWERVAMVLNKATAFSIVAAVGTLAMPQTPELLQRHDKRSKRINRRRKAKVQKARKAAGKKR
jgi:hypothetical protein